MIVFVVVAVNSPQNVALWNEIRSHYKCMLFTLLDFLFFSLSNLR